MNRTVPDHVRLGPYAPRILSDPAIRPGWWRTEGTLVFADISGFTALSERLAREGRVGAEELVRNLSEVFTALLSATEDGGDLLKFGGDALLLLYVGDDHAARAVHAAAGMRAALRRAGRISTPAGTVTLRMSVGAASGEIGCYLVGDDHLELLVLGPTVTETVAMEGAADAGEILLAPSTAARLPAGAAGPAKDGGTLLATAPKLPPLPTSAPPVPPDVARFVAPPLRARLGFGDVHDHRRCTVAFVHLGGIDEQLVTEGPDSVFAAADRVQRAVEEAAGRYEASLVCTDVAGDGAKWMLVAGAPVTHEDDERRMLLAGRHILDGCPDLPIRIGVNAGHVFAGDVGAPFRRTYSVMGDTTNLAARVMGRAAYGELLAHRDVLDRAGPGVVARAIEPFLAKGKALPVHAALVDAVDEPTGARDPDETAGAYVGREVELAALAAAADAAAQGRGAVVEVVGDAGLGKTRLLAEALDRRADLDTVTVRAEPYRMDRPYGIARTMLRTLWGIDTRLDPATAGVALADLVAHAAPALTPWLPLLAIAVGAEVAPTPEVDDLVEEFRDDRLREVVTELAIAVLGDRAVALVLDDAQWADHASRRLLTRLAREVPGSRWLVVVTRRSGSDGLFGEPHGPVTVELTDLADADADVVARGALSRSVPDHDVRAIVARAGGNPLFLLELAASAGEATLPASVETTVAARIDGLAPADRAALRALAVLGSSFAERAVAWVDPGGTIGRATWERLQPFVERDGDIVRFRHELFREVAYEGLTFGARRSLHASVAAALATGTAPEQAASVLALHWSRAQRWDEAWHWSRVAGAQARAANAPEDAVAALRQAVDAGRRLRPPQPAALAATWEQLGEVCNIAGRLEEAVDAYRRALRADPQVLPARRADLAIHLGIATERTGRLRSALRWMTSAIRLAADVEDAVEAGRIRARASARLAGLRLRQGRLRDCVVTATTAVAEAEAVGDRPALANAAFLLDAALTDLGDTEAALRWRPVALPIFEEEGDLVSQANVLNNLGANAYYEDRLEEALVLYGRDEALRLRAGDTIGAAMASGNIAEALADLGRTEEAMARFAAARRTFAGAGYQVGEAFATGQLGRLLTSEGQAQEAVPLLDEALESFRALGLDGLVTETLVRRAEALLAVGRTADARADALAAQARIPGSANPALARAADAVLAATSSSSPRSAPERSRRR